MKRKTKNLIMSSMATTAFAGWLMFYGTYLYFINLKNAGIDFSWVGVILFLFIAMVGKPLAYIREEVQKEKKKQFEIILLRWPWVIIFPVAVWYGFHKIDYGFALSGKMLSTAILSILLMLVANVIFYLETVVLEPKALQEIKTETEPEE